MLVNHQTLAQYCIDSYRERTFVSRDVEVLYLDLPHCHVFAIRGTEADKFISGRGWKDVIRDLAIWPRDIGATFGHAGFVAGWDSIVEEVLEIAQKQLKPVVLTGHSLGGAIALVGTYELIRHGQAVECVTFGAPRALVPAGMVPVILGAMLGCATQYEHYRDPVPALLGWTDYKHINSVITGSFYRAPWFMRRKKFHSILGYRNYFKGDE